MKLGTRLIIFSSIFLVLIPWFGLHFIEKIEQSLLQGQEEAQSMAASAIATVLNGYTELFDVDEDALYVYPVKQDIDIDGYDEDWEEISDQFISYGNSDFSLLMVEQEQFLYAYLRVNDGNIVYRNPRNIPLDTSDHIRLEYLDKNNSARKLVLLAEGQGNVSVYEVKDDWQTWVSGRHINAVYGVWHETGNGYDVEFRLPREWLEPNRRLSVSVVNMFSENERNIDTIVSTHTLDKNILNPLLFQSQKINRVIENLGKSDSRICVIDKYRRVRAVMGGQRLHARLCQSIDKVSETMVSRVLQGDLQVSRFVENGETLIVAAHPVFEAEEVIGAVLVSKNSRQILSLQRETLLDIVLAMAGIFVFAFFSLLAFSSWLAYRINRLTSQTSSLIDESGRFVQQVELPDTHHGDEVGELARSFSSLLDRLNRYTCFLETVPRMLRHEILNPVNTISMSLQNIQQQQGAPDSKAANNAIRQLQLIVSSLTEAANIDEALNQVDVEKLDIAELLSEYVSNSQQKHSNAILHYHGKERGVFVNGSDLRIVQLLDKIKDNALDFSRPGSEIRFLLETKSGNGQNATVNSAIIRIINDGEIIPQEQLESLFQGMVSHRAKKSGKPHLGIGLYVARQIARFHHGQLKIANRGDKQGVEVVLILPLAAE